MPLSFDEFVRRNKVKSILLQREKKVKQFLIYHFNCVFFWHCKKIQNVIARQALK